jgi:hypothetical protein
MQGRVAVVNGQAVTMPRWVVGRTMTRIVIGVASNFGITLVELHNDYMLECQALILDILLGFTKERKHASILENE